MFDEKIFIPESSKTVFDSYSCHIIRGSDIISYNKDTCNSTSCHLSVFVVNTKHYLVQYQDLILSQDKFDSYITSCDYPTYENYTTDVFYRSDIDSILVIFIILLLIMFYFPYRIIARMFGRWFKW